MPFIQNKGIVVQCWYPLGGRGYTAELLGDETICAIAEAHGVSAAQVILRWDLQRGIVVIPGSGNEQHITILLSIISPIRKPRSFFAPICIWLWICRAI